MEKSELKPSEMLIIDDLKQKNPEKCIHIDANGKILDCTCEKTGKSSIPCFYRHGKRIPENSRKYKVISGFCGFKFKEYIEKEFSAHDFFIENTSGTTRRRMSSSIVLK